MQDKKIEVSQAAIVNLQDSIDHHKAQIAFLAGALEALYDATQRDFEMEVEGIRGMAWMVGQMNKDVSTMRTALYGLKEEKATA